MPASKVALIASALAALAWAAKAVVIGAAGGLDRSPLEGPLFLLGLVSFVVGAAALGVAVAAGRSVLVRGAGALAVVLAFLLVGAVVSSAVAAVQPDDPGWVWSEVNLWVGALVLLAAVVAVRRTRGLRSRPGGAVAA